jgi:Mrp family chromosome partitioning ATPase
MILIDTPPLISLSDARVLAQCADAVILVVRSGHTNRNMALIAREQLNNDGTPLLGTILTDWNPQKAKGTPSGLYSHYMRSYLRYYQRSHSSES